MVAKKSPRGFPQRVLIAPDKFKGTLTSEAAAHAIERGLKRAWPGVKTTRVILSDGGEGFAETMTAQTGGKLRRSRTTNAIGKICTATWGVLGNGTTAVIGLANASGIAQLKLAERNPELTTNAGTGRLIALAVEAGYREIVVGLGGSATTEGGVSLAAAIGYQFLDHNGREIPLTGHGLASLARIIPPARLPKVKFVVATDVGNPLCGRLGAAAQFGPQKGADAAMVKRLDANLRRLAKIVKRDLGHDRSREPGAGSAGGSGYGLMAFFDARREDGFHLVRRLSGLDEMVRTHDLVLTGEGCFDRTSLLGKAPCQLAQLARKMKRPTWGLCGRANLPLVKTPFVRLGALSTKENPGPAPETLTSAQHAKRLEVLAYEMALG